jgi:hypothetical protein
LGNVISVHVLFNALFISLPVIWSSDRVVSIVSELDYLGLESLPGQIIILFHKNYGAALGHIQSLV